MKASVIEFVVSTAGGGDTKEVIVGAHDVQTVGQETAQSVKCALCLSEDRSLDSQRPCGSQAQQHVYNMCLGDQRHT